MLRDDVLALLKAAGAVPLSGEAMSKTLGLSRAAVWKAIEALRREGYEISSAPHRGYRLEGSPDLLSIGEVSGALEAGCVVGSTFVYLDSVDSTNNEIKRRAMEQVPDGLTVVADTQTGGRGRQGRSFSSPPGKGLYLSALLRPRCAISEAPAITAWTAVAVCQAIEAVCGVQAGIKWPNDVVLDGKKLCGILTELGLEGESGTLQYVVVGIGINVGQTTQDFDPVLFPLATSLRLALGTAPRRADLAVALLNALDRLNSTFPAQKDQWLSQYRARCLTTGQTVRILRQGGTEESFAEEINDDFALIVRHKDGQREVLSSGEVSVRGLLGYS